MSTSSSATKHALPEEEPPEECPLFLGLITGFLLFVCDPPLKHKLSQ